MKKIFLATTAIVFSAGVSYAQTNTGTAADQSQALAINDNRSVADKDTNVNGNRVTARDGGDFADAFIKDGRDITRATANRPSQYPTVASGSSNLYGISVEEQPANANIQFQVGNMNQSINVQNGAWNESATLQVGYDNDAIISQGGYGTEAGIAQTGDENLTTIIQDGDLHAAAAATRGDHNESVILQTGDYNVAANGILGHHNSALTFQNDGENTAAQLQVGDYNQSFISQGGGTMSDLMAVDGTVGNVHIPNGLTASQAVAGAASYNAAASVQVGDSNRNAIVQQGNNNEAVNYQNSM